jgi:thiazole synthase
MTGTATEKSSEAFRIGNKRLNSRLILGTGKYESFETMQRSFEAAEVDCVTIAVRRERLHDAVGRNILDFLDPQRLILLPNTAGCYDAETAVRCARMGREILKGLENPGFDWVKLEVLGDSRTLLPDPIETLAATEQLVADGFQVLCYTSDDPITARATQRSRREQRDASRKSDWLRSGILNPNNLRLILEDLKRDDPDYPLIVDAGVGTASDVSIAMELGFDGVLMNSGVAMAVDPINMAQAMQLALRAGRLARASGRIQKSRFGSASSPEIGVISRKMHPEATLKGEFLALASHFRWIVAEIAHPDFNDMKISYFTSPNS